MVRPRLDQHHQRFKRPESVGGGEDLLGVCAVMNEMIAFKGYPLPSVLIAMLVEPLSLHRKIAQTCRARFCAKLLSLGVFAFSGVKRFAQFRPFFGGPILNDFYNLIASDL